MIQVFGHKAPDTDSTGSPLIWAWYLSDVRKTPAKAVLQGTPNTEAVWMLGRWGLDLPEVIADLAQNPARAEDLERVKTQLIAEAIYAQDNQATLARWYGGALTTGLSIDDIRSWPDRIRAVTAEQVRAAAATWLDKKRSVTGYLIKDTAPKREEKRS